MKRQLKMPLSKTKSNEPLVHFEQDFIPVEDFEYGFIKQTDGKLVKILEVEPCEYIFKSAEEQWEMAQNFCNIFDCSCVNLHIKIKNKAENTMQFLSEVANDYSLDENKFVKERKEDYLEICDTYVSETAVRKVFYFIFSAENTSDKTEGEILEDFDMTVNEYISQLQAIGCTVVERSCSDADYPIEVLYSCLNPTGEKKETVAQRHERILNDYYIYSCMSSKSKEATYNDLICPKGIDFTCSDSYMITDGLYQTFLTVRGNSIPQNLPSNFINELSSSGCDVDIYTNRLNNAKVMSGLKVGEKGKQLTSTTNENTNDTSKIEEKYGYMDNLNYIRSALLNEQHYFETVIILTFRNTSVKELFAEVDVFKQKFTKAPYYLKFRETYCNAEELYKMTLPLMAYSENNETFKLNSRGFLTNSFVGLMPFYSKDVRDVTGAIWGINLLTGGILSINPFNREMDFQNANIAILGGSGSGKTFAEMSIGSKLYLSGIRTFYVCPLKGHEYENLAKSFNGTFVNLLPLCDCINLFEIRPEITNRLQKPIPLLTKKITQITTFLKLSMPSMTDKELGKLNIALMGLYNTFGITTENDSIFDENHNLKAMPTFSDLDEYMGKYEDLAEVKDHIQRYISGSWKNLNGQTNVDLTKKCIVINCDEDHVGKEFLAPIMYLAIITEFDIIKSDGKHNDIMFVDEVWKCLTTEEAGEQIKEIAKVIRGFQGGLCVATQDIGDFLSNPYGDAIVSACNTKIVKHMEGGINDPRSECVKTCNALGVDVRTYVPIINKLTQKNGIIFTPKQSVSTRFFSSFSERILYGTDDRSNSAREWLIRNRGWGEKTMLVTVDDAYELVHRNILKKSFLEA